MHRALISIAALSLALAPITRADEPGGAPLEELQAVGTCRTFVLRREARSATALALEALRALAPQLDRPARIRIGIQDVADRCAEAVFVGGAGGQHVCGMVVASVDGAKGTAGIVFDRGGLAARTVPTGLRRLAKHIDPTAPRPVETTRVTVADGSATIELPAGWRVTSAWQGAVDIVGDRDQAMQLGYSLTVVTPEGNAGPAKAALVCPLTTPVEALRVLTPQLAAAIRRVNPGLPELRVGRIRESADTPLPNGRASFVLWDYVLGREQRRALTVVGVQPLGGVRWQLYLSGVSSPAARFAEDLPRLLQAWGSWSVSQKVLAARLQKALQSMKETHQLLRDAHDYRIGVYTKANAAWDGYIRDNATLLDPQTGYHYQVAASMVQQLVQQKNWKAGWNRYKAWLP